MRVEGRAEVRTQTNCTYVILQLWVLEEIIFSKSQFFHHKIKFIKHFFTYMTDIRIKKDKGREIFSILLFIVANF